MPLSTAPSPTVVKMEDRKRPISGTDDIAPPSKRQAVNGGGKSKDDADTKEEAWIEDYQKDAIYRQMLEYKREKSTLEARLADAVKRSTYHDDHLRIVDAWWVQLLQEVGIIAKGAISITPESEESPFPSYTHFRDLEEFESHLAERSKIIKGITDGLFNRLVGSRGHIPPKTSELESEMTRLLANQKDYGLKLDRLNSDKDTLSDQLNTATLRYMKAERRLDRLKSAQVQKLEQQAFAQATARPPSGDAENGAEGENGGGHNEALQTALQESKAIASKQTEQLESALTQIKTLQEENTTLQTKLTNLTDEEYSRTEVFKLFKNQNEELTRRVNHLEASCKILQSTNEQLSKERESVRRQVESEAQNLIAELEDQLQQADTNLARVRAARDELMAEVAQLRAGKEHDYSATTHMKELVSAKDEEIKALESQLSRLKPADQSDSAIRPDIEGLPLEELQQKYQKLARDYDSIENELPGMTAAVKKYQQLAQKKLTDFSVIEDKLRLLAADKSRADQKYFGARKDSDIKGEEIKRLRTQYGKSSEIISQLKDVEAHNRMLVTNLDKQLAEYKQTNSAIMAESKKTESSSNDALRRYEAMKQQVAELTSMAKSKDSTTSLARERTISLETEVEKLRARFDAVSKDRDKWKVKSLGNSSEEEEMLRNLATCSICRNRFKDTVLRTCGHIFCKSCVDDRIANRMRKCPTCNKSFDKADAMGVHL